MDRLLGMEVFVAVVERGSFTAAAEAFGLSQPMVGKHIRALEQRLGARLLARTTRRQHLTEIGEQYYQRCRHILAEIRDAEIGAERLHQAPRGMLKINAPVTFGSLRLAPALGEFMVQYPEVSVELALSDQVVDLVEEGCDALIRIGTLVESGLVARPLAPYRMMVCAAPAYLQRWGTPRTPGELAGHQWLGHSLWEKHAGWRLPTGADAVDPPAARFQSNNGQALRMVALQGGGIVMQPEVLLAEDVAAGRLVEILADYLPSSKPMHVLYLPDRQQVPKLRAFIDFVLQRFGA
ncbi:LysR family transcriptional regulator [Pseudogulbenkiania ferrooxidans]|uniref:Transcriptional regulator, LysR family n=1 Tax=Pseudogulbenkiania ferrooxidans 2002 TaxID=279714 RepID=B9Z6C3_9NEIS|nr:LysR family transcriptional regulator [Pseudogulbenkiania ferrooxidans]EEG07498.1 transcriptional regulator, LysR family [Pseudogulbenkiania ferrooxidans 2002]